MHAQQVPREFPRNEDGKEDTALTREEALKEIARIFSRETDSGSCSSDPPTGVALVDGQLQAHLTKQLRTAAFATDRCSSGILPARIAPSASWQISVT